MLQLTKPNTLFIGLGGTGGRVLKELRLRLFDELEEIPSGVAFMYIDSTDELMHFDDPSWMTPEGQNAQFFMSEYLNLSQSRVDSLATLPMHFPNLKGIIENCESLKCYQPGTGSMQDRRLGRVFIGVYAAYFSNMLHQQVVALQKKTGYSDINFNIITGLSGGTGSGAVVSVIDFILRTYPEAKINVYATLPVVPCPYDHGRSLANTYAALLELNALNIGRLKVTDLLTGEQNQPEMPYDSSLNYCHRLQENKLFRLFLFDNFLREYDKIANILYYNLLLSNKSSEIETYLRAIDMYSTIPAPESDASTPEGEYLEARTKAVGSFGLYRIVYPRKPILRHVAYHVAAQSYFQMLFNNYVEGLGYMDAPAHIDCTITRRELEQWRMAPDYLLLDRAILPQQQRYSPFRDEWDMEGEWMSKEAKHHDHPIQFLEVQFKAYFDERFREEGVEVYFRHEEIKVNDYVREIVSHYETSQYQLWHRGEMGIYDLTVQSDKLIGTIQQGIARLPEEIEFCKKKIQECQDNLIQNRTTFQNSLFAKLFKKKEYILQQKEYLVLYYYHKTRFRALEFERRLSEALVLRLRSLQSDLENLAHCMKEEISRIQDLIQKEEEPPADTLNVVDWNWVRKYENALIGNRMEIQRMTSSIRMHYAEKSEGSILQLIDPFRSQHEVKNILPKCMKLVEAYDAMLYPIDRIDKNLLNVIGEQNLSEEQLRQTLRQALEKVNEHIRFNDNERMRTVRNNPLPESGPWSQPQTVTLVRIPRAMGREEETISQQLNDTVRALSFAVTVDNKSDFKYEIIVASVITRFPLRYLEVLPSLKHQYDQLMADERHQARYTLHTEDSFTDLPSLEVEKYIEPPVEKTEITDLLGLPPFPSASGQ